MPVIEELICMGQDGTISFDNCKLGQEAKRFGFEYQEDMYEVETYNEIAKLERNDMFIYESVPETAAEHFKVTDKDVESAVKGSKDAQITIQLENDTDYEIHIDGTAVDGMKTNTSDKLSISMELGEGISVQVKAVKRAQNLSIIQAGSDSSLFLSVF